jgi:hypothetical protein
MKEGGDGGGRWGIVDIIELGKHCIAMTGEKDGKLENTTVCVRLCYECIFFDIIR